MNRKLHQEKKILILGFGNQAKAWALNLRDSGWEVDIALREGSPSYSMARELSFSVVSFSNIQSFEVVAMLLPDQVHHEVLKQYQFHPQARILFAHGVSQLDAPQSGCSHLLLAPKTIASELRFRYETKGALAAVASTQYSKTPEYDTELLLLIAHDLGIKAGLTFATFEEEAKADLFSEQTLLCGLVPYAAAKSFELLVDKGVNPEIAYYECWLELMLITKTMVEKGPEEFFDLISPHALVGSQVAKELLIDKDYAKKIQFLWEKIESKEFHQLVDQMDIKKTRDQAKSFWHDHPLQKTHNEMRGNLFS